jgi:hypothetical protein
MFVGRMPTVFNIYTKLEIERADDATDPYIASHDPRMAAAVRQRKGTVVPTNVISVAPLIATA